MRYEDLIRNPESLDVVLQRITDNKGYAYLWYPVINKKGVMFEVGGTNGGGELRFKAYIPKFKDGKHVVMGNGFIDSHYALTNEGQVEFDSFNDTHKIKDLVKFLDNTDFRTYRPKVKHKEVISYNTVSTVTM